MTEIQEVVVKQLGPILLQLGYSPDDMTGSSVIYELSRLVGYSEFRAVMVIFGDGWVSGSVVRRGLDFRRQHTPSLMECNPSQPDFFEHIERVLRSQEWRP